MAETSPHIPYSEGYYEGEQYSCYPNGPHRGGEGSPNSSVVGDSASILAARATSQIKPQAITLPKVLPTPERPHIGGPEGGGGVEFSHYPTPGTYGSYNYPPGGSLPRDYNKPRHAVPPGGFFPDYSATIRPNYTHGPRNASFQDYDYHGSYAGSIRPPSPPSADSPHRRSAAVPPSVLPKEHPDYNHHTSFEEAAAVMAAAASEYGATTPSPAAADRYASAYASYPPPAGATSPGYTPGSHFEAGPQGYLDRRPSYDDRPPPHLLYGARGDVVDGTARVEGSEGRDVRWRDPDLHEVIDFLSHPNNVVQANAAAYLQHLSYMDDNVKQKTRALGGISPLIELLNQDIPEIQRNACGALRNLSFGRQNEENKRAIRNAGGIPTIVRLLRKTPDNEIRELLTGVLWNLSSSEDLKKPIIDDALSVLVSHIIIPHSGWDHSEQPQDIYWSTVFRNASGVLRNISSAGEYARRRLRECEGLVDALLHLVRAAVSRNDMDNKSVENCVCTLRNLSYRCQEVEDPDYDRHASSSSSQPFQSRAMLPIKVVGENLGCFGASRKKKEASSSHHQGSSGSSLGDKTRRTGSGEQIGNNTTSGGAKPRQGSEPLRGMDLLWQPEVVQPYLSLLSECSNPETLEAAAGAIQNLAACYWQPSIDIRAAVRKEKGLPILVELLRMEVDRVVCAVATALRNLAMDQRNKELIGKYAMKDLVQKLPNGSPQHDAGTSDDTVAAVLATLNEVVVRNGDFARSLLEAGGVERLTYITKQKGKFSPRVVKFTSQLLFNLWQHQELREVYRKAGWKESHFLTRTLVASRGNSGGALSPATSANNTLSRPISSQGTTHYEDRTLRARELNPANAGNATTPNNPGTGVPYSRSEDLALNDLAHGADPARVAAAGNPPTSMQSPNTPIEPLYAQVNREKKKNRQQAAGMVTTNSQGAASQQPSTTISAPTTMGGDLSAVQPPPPLLHDSLAPGQDVGAATVIQAGDSWV